MVDSLNFVVWKKGVVFFFVLQEIFSKNFINYDVFEIGYVRIIVREVVMF